MGCEQSSVQQHWYSAKQPELFSIISTKWGEGEPFSMVDFCTAPCAAMCVGDPSPNSETQQICPSQTHQAVMGSVSQKVGKVHLSQGQFTARSD